MKTMGLRKLRIAGKLPNAMEGARTLAVHALDLLEGAQPYPGLEEAVRGSSLVVGVTRRTGTWRKQARICPEDLPALVARHGGSPVSLVFGNEVSGLTDAELGCCHHALAIPSSPRFPSLNLSHAVQIVAYALYRGLEDAAPRRSPAIAGVRLEELTESLMASLRAAGFFRQGYEADLRVLYRDLFARAALSEHEAARVERCFHVLRALIDGLASPRLTEPHP